MRFNIVFIFILEVIRFAFNIKYWFILSLRYTDENTSETLNKKGYNHYKFSFMLFKNPFYEKVYFSGFYYWAACAAQW